MNHYFDEIVSSLTINDLKILGALNDEDAELSFKAIRRKNLLELSGLTEAMFRKTLSRLEVAKLISIVSGQKEHKIFITEFGKSALFNSLSKEVF